MADGMNYTLRLNREHFGHQFVSDYSQSTLIHIMTDAHTTNNFKLINEITLYNIRR